MSMDSVNSKPQVGDVISDGPNHNGVDPGDGTAILPGGMSCHFDDINEYYTLNSLFIPMIYDLIGYNQKMAVYGSALVGCIFNPRLAKRLSQQCARAVDQLTYATDPRAFGYIYVEGDPRSDEVAEGMAQSMLQKGYFAEVGARKAAGLLT